MFRDINKIKTVVDYLFALKQTGSALTYSMEF
jgi:hypothetical protein